MRIVPVIDLKGGVVVHAVRGRRAAYRPVRSTLVAGAEPAAVAAALRRAAGTDELYVADLDAIEGRPAAPDDAAARASDPSAPACAAGASDPAAPGAATRASDPSAPGAAAAPIPHAATLRALAGRARVLADTGIADVAGLDAVRALGAAAPVIGTERLGPGGLQALLADRPGVDVTLSLDLRDGGLLSGDPALRGADPAAAIAALAHPQVSAILVLDLGRVGSEGGPPLAAVRAVVAARPGAPVLAGGGVRDAADLRALAAAGAAGALVATALHTGTLRGTP